MTIYFLSFHSAAKWTNDHLIDSEVCCLLMLLCSTSQNIFWYPLLWVWVSVKTVSHTQIPYHKGGSLDKTITFLTWLKLQINWENSCPCVDCHHAPMCKSVSIRLPQKITSLFYVPLGCCILIFYHQNTAKLFCKQNIKATLVCLG